LAEDEAIAVIAVIVATAATAATATVDTGDGMPVTARMAAHQANSTHNFAEVLDVVVVLLLLLEALMMGHGGFRAYTKVYFTLESRKIASRCVAMSKANIPRQSTLEFGR